MSFLYKFINEPSLFCYYCYTNHIFIDYMFSNTYLFLFLLQLSLKSDRRKVEIKNTNANEIKNTKNTNKNIFILYFIFTDALYFFM